MSEIYEFEVKKRLEAYLGDGLYAEFDGYQIILKAPRDNGVHWVGLEPEVYNALVKFKDSIEAHVKEMLEGEKE